MCAFWWNDSGNCRNTKCTLSPYFSFRSCTAVAAREQNGHWKSENSTIVTLAFAGPNAGAGAVGELGHLLGRQRLVALFLPLQVREHLGVMLEHLLAALGREALGRVLDHRRRSAWSSPMSLHSLVVSSSHFLRLLAELLEAEVDVGERDRAGFGRHQLERALERGAGAAKCRRSLCRCAPQNSSQALGETGFLPCS